MKALPLLLALGALFLSCQMPISGPAKTSGAGLKLNFLMAGTEATSRSATPAKLLLPTANKLVVTLTPTNGGAVVTQNSSIAVGSSLVTVSFGQVNFGSYTVLAQAFDSSGTLQFQQTSPLTLSATTNSIMLNLVPASASGLNPLTSGQIVTATMPPGTAISWSVPSTMLVSGGWSLSTSADPTVLLFTQDSNGVLFPPADTKGALTTVQVTDSSTSFVTLYNSGTLAQPVSLVLNSPGTSPTIANLTGTWAATPSISTQTTAGVTTSYSNSVAYTFNADSSLFILGTSFNTTGGISNYYYNGYWGTYAVSGNLMTITITSELSSKSPIGLGSTGAQPVSLVQTFPAFLYNGLFYSGYNGNGGALLTASGPTSGLLGTWIENINLQAAGVAENLQLSITLSSGGVFSTTSTVSGSAAQTLTQTGTYTVSNGQLTTTSVFSDGTTNSGTDYYAIIGCYLSIGGDVNAGGYAKQNVIPVSSITLQNNGTAITGTVTSPLYVSSGYQMTAVVSPSNASNPTVIWSSTDNTVATVDSTGLVTVVGSVGTTTITATAIDGSGTSVSIVVTPLT